MESRWVEQHDGEEVEQVGERQAKKGGKGISVWGGAVVGLVLMGAGFYLGNHYQLIWPGQWPFIPEVVMVGRGNTVASDPLFAQVQQLMETKYLRSNELDQRQMLYGSISGMVASAGDPYTAFFDPEANQASEEQLSGRFSGVGLELGFNKEGQMAVVAPISDTPAARAGVMAGDVLLSVDEKPVKGKTLQEVVNMIRGQEGTKVTLIMQRGAEANARTFALTRQQITIKSVELEFKDEVAYVKLTRFGETTNAEWDAAVDQIVARGSKSMILDMRNNPGGFLDSAIHISSEFFKDGMVVGQQDSSGKITRYNVEGRNRLTAIQVTVLINGGSASASEIVAGALNARDRAVLVGVTSFGKGSVQQVIPLVGNTSLHVTIARWVMPDDSNIDGQGIRPAVEVKMTSEDIEAGRDPQLERALVEARK